MILSTTADINNILCLIMTICTLIGVIGALIPTIVNLIKSFKQIIKEKDWNRIIEFTKEAITIAEASGKSGEEKKAFVIEHVKAACATVGIEVDEETLKSLADSIDDLVAWFNKMKQANLSCH